MVIAVKILDHLMDRLFLQCAEAVLLLLPGQQKIRHLIKITAVFFHILKGISFLILHTSISPVLIC